MYKFWDLFLGYIEERVNVQSFNTWFKPLIITALSDDTLVISVPKKYFSSWIEEHYMPLLNQAIYKISEKELSIKFVISDSNNVSMEEHISSSPAVSISNVSENQPFFFENQTINPRFTFNSFVVGQSNQFAYAASKAVAEAPGTTAFNPLVIYGGVGLGKTHLLQAIATHYLSSSQYSDDKKRVRYLSSEKFTMDFIMSIQKNLTTQHSNYYRSSNLLLVDDIQFFNNKERTQEEFFHIFNALHQNGKQIVLCMDRPPSQLKGLADRLINRFQWGLVTDIQPPDFETRVAILKKKAEADSVYLDNSIATFIAENITSNIRELEGSLIRLLAYSSLNGEDMSLEMAENVLGHTFIKKNHLITIEYLQKLVAEHFSLSINAVMSDSRQKEVTIARHIAIYLCKQLTNSSLKTIGLHFGGRDHSTVIHSIQNVKKKYLSNPVLSNHIRMLTEKAKSL